jgi:CheY-like chemotaxis protein
MRPFASVAILGSVAVAVDVRGVARAQCRRCGAHATVRVADGTIVGTCATCNSPDLVLIEGAPALLSRRPAALQEDSASAPVSVVMIDDHPLILEAVQRLLDTAEIRIVGVAGDGVNGLDLIRELRPQVAVIDLEIPRMNGLELIRSIDEERLPTRTLLYTGHESADVLEEALAAGAAGVVVKRSPVRRLAAAIIRVAGGERFLDPHVDVPGAGSG